ncbi:MAG TPA: type II toxin-antitoxin system RelE/ParE family toxin [Ktedonosporobacter sp.]|nr:type II toxin-antitoxin system RelE/ParE family toxin [Ktedonosporobacter sp.]
MSDQSKVIRVKFFRTSSGTEPVREWLKELGRDDSSIIGQDIKTIEFGWPLGMPLCRSISGHKNLWEARSKITGGRIARVIFYIHNGEMILLHGFIKKSQKTPQSDLNLADKRRMEHEKHG